MYYYGARYYDPRISIFVSVDQMVESTMTPYQYVHNNPINLIDPTGMSAEGPGDGGGFWNKVRSFFGMSSIEKPQQDIDDGSTVLDEIVIPASKKPSIWKRMGFSKDKISRDWKDIKEKSGYNHFRNYKKDMVGGTGGLIINGISTYNMGSAEIPGPYQHINVTDLPGFTGPGQNLTQKITEGLTKLASLNEDQNIRSWFLPKEKDPYVHHKFKKFGIYRSWVIDKDIILGITKDTVLRRSEIEQFDKDRQFDSIQLIPLLNK